MNVIIKRQVAAHNIDAFNRVAVADVDLENGSVFELKTRSTNDGEDEVWNATAPADATATGVWMAKSSEVTLTKIGEAPYAVEFKGIVEDPRMFTNVAGYVFDAFKPVAGDLIETTQGDDTNTILALDAGKFALKATTDAPADGFYMEKVGTSILHIGSAGLVKTPVKTFIYEVKAN
jgi:hypothetical protein